MTTAASPAAQPPHPPLTLAGKLRTAAGDIKLAHSVFALPFAILGALLAIDAAPFAGFGPARIAGLLALVVLCMVFARTWAMLVNRVLDRDIDARNPRTQRRAFAAGHLSPRDGALLLAACAFAFCACCALFWLFFANPWPLILSLPVLVWIGFYSLTKRFTALCHVFLGGALAASPLAAAIAVRPEALGETPALWLLAGMVLLWVAGFDVIYALQDLDFDRRTGLHSIPAKLGWRRAAWVSRAMHLGAAACLVAAWLADPRLALLFGLGVACTVALLVAEHAVLARRGQAGLDMAFFTLNGVISLLLGLLGSLDVFL